MCLFVYDTGYVKAADQLSRTTTKPYSGLPVQGDGMVPYQLLNNQLIATKQVWLYPVV